MPTTPELVALGDITAAIVEMEAAAAKVSGAMAKFEAEFTEHGMKIALECGVRAIRLSGAKDDVIEAAHAVAKRALALEDMLAAFTGREPREVPVSRTIRLTAETWAALDKMAQKRRTDRYNVYKTEGRAEALRRFPKLPHGNKVSDLLVEAVALLLEQQSKKPKAA